jgi:hypothetical protein
MASNTCITVEDIRLYILDRTIEDNDMDKDLSFSDEEIIAAMERAAREYNSIPPYVGCVEADALPKNTNMFFDATVQQLYIAELNRMSRNDIDYDAGGVSTNLEAKRIEHLKQLSRDHGERFREAATNLKIHTNWMDGFGKIG